VQPEVDIGVGVNSPVPETFDVETSNNEIGDADIEEIDP